ncbi:gamma-glutamyl hydrolase A-like [Corticium candelabrum]|uniref:gamma-glutamyl hydrolase A-like n=1 Tax=Corticium candelabrum TaxID=121492 RepID=UPI002E26EB7F|nr:gamma-glutamyl hydrolase A-like [Corticium candelabrum]
MLQVFFVFVLVVSVGALSGRPIIGILTQDTYESHHGNMYLAASYVKYVESSGARVVPIFINHTESELKFILGSINGVLFPGGGASLKPNGSGFIDTAMRIYDYFVEENLAGRFFPLWGTCLGFETLTVLVAGRDLLTPCDAENYSIPLVFEPGFNASRMFKGATDDMIRYLSNENVTMNNHRYCVTLETFIHNEKLNSTFNILSTNKDRNGITFVSSVEGRLSPIFGTHWHPEKNAFEWTRSEGIDHSADAVAVTQYMGNVLVQQARTCDHHFPNDNTEAKYLIYNYQPVYTGNVSHSFEQCYYW